MLRLLNHNNMGRSKLGWLDSYFHFSFADYNNPNNIKFGILRVINDDLIKSGTGFDTHPHKNMEIITYLVDGELTHIDSMKNKRTLKRGEVQYMSAGNGVTHSEYNNGNELLRLLQIWILPDKEGYAPNYGDYLFSWNDRINKWLHLVTGINSDYSFIPIKIHADVNIYVTYITNSEPMEFNMSEGRQGYLVLIEGEVIIRNHTLVERDALEIIEENILIQAKNKSHILIIEMKKS